MAGCDCPTSDPGRWRCPGTWMTPLQSQCCSWWWVEGEQGGVSPEVHDHLRGFERVKLQVVKTAPDSQLLNFLSVSRLVTVLDEADQSGVVCKLHELDRGVFRCAVIHIQGRRVVGRDRSPEELQCWSYGCWMRVFPASLAAVCLSASCWSTDRWRWARRAELVWAGGGLE